MEIGKFRNDKQLFSATVVVKIVPGPKCGSRFSSPHVIENVAPRLHRKKSGRDTLSLERRLFSGPWPAIVAKYWRRDAVPKALKEDGLARAMVNQLVQLSLVVEFFSVGEKLSRRGVNVD